MRTFIVMGFDGAATGRFVVCGNNLAVESAILGMLDNQNIKHIYVYDRDRMNLSLYWEAQDVTYKKVTFDPARIS